MQSESLLLLRDMRRLRHSSSSEYHLMRTGKATVTSLGTDLPGSYDSQTDLITFENDPIKVDTATGGMIVTVEEEGTKRRVPNATVEIEAPSIYKAYSYN
jgi:hypothetical protein